MNGRHYIGNAFATLALVLAVTGCSDDRDGGATANDLTDASPKNLGNHAGHVVVANRGSGTITVIDTSDYSVVATHPLPMESGDATPEPMYVVHVPSAHRVFVDDRANDRVVVFDDADYTVEGLMPTGDGPFHMWADAQGRQIWVNNDIDNTSTAFDGHDLTVLATVPTPADLVALGGKPHDVVVSPRGDRAFVTVNGVVGDHDYVVQFETSGYTEVGRAPVGKDAHLSLARQHPWLYVPCQMSNVVIVLNRANLEQVAVIDVPGAHGAAMIGSGKRFYTTNISGGGADALWVIDTRTQTVIGEPADAPYGVPHNIATDPSGHELYVTHSGGASDKVTVYRALGGTPTPEFAAEVTVGSNPFGLAFVR